MDTELDDAPRPPTKPRIAILGGGMGGVATAWRLSEPGWRDRFESITVFQRGWRLGGKGASSRGPNGRIEEHGLHVWLGYYDNAFRLLRECYGELDRPRTRPGAPILTWEDAFVPSSDIGMEDRYGDAWHHWIGHFSPNDGVPGEPDGLDPSPGPGELLGRAARLLGDFVESFEPEPASVELRSGPAAAPRRPASAAAASVLAAGALVEGLALATPDVVAAARTEAIAAVDIALEEIRLTLGAVASEDHAARRTWHLVGVIAAVARGLVADGVLTSPEGFRALDDEDFCDWIRRHGAPEEAIASTFVRGLYDLVFGHVDGDPNRPSFAAGVGVCLSTKILFGYQGSIFWKMTAGMGDVVFAPLYEALRARGVRIELFHRLDGLHPSRDGTTIDRVTLGRQVALAPEVDQYDALVEVGGLPCFPAAPLVDQLECGEEVREHPLEAVWCTWGDAERRVLQRGVDFDQVVFAMPPPVAGLVCRELIAQRPEWRRMVDNLATVSTQVFQLWLREDEATLGWSRSGVTVTGFVDGFDTWASMPQLIPAERWPGDECRAIAYFCNTFATAWPPARPWPEHAVTETDRVKAAAKRFCSTDLGHLLPGAVGPEGFRWELLCGADGDSGEAAFDSQYWRANVDPSDRYVLSLPGTLRHRLRPDESGYDNLVLAGDWTDNGLNAGCIEAAVVSGLQAANALLGRHRFHRISGSWLA